MRQHATLYLPRFILTLTLKTQRDCIFTYTQWDSAENSVKEHAIMNCPNEFCPLSIAVYTSNFAPSPAGEGWDEEYVNGCFYSHHPNPLQQEKGDYISL